MMKLRKKIQSKATLTNDDSFVLRLMVKILSTIQSEKHQKLKQGELYSILSTFSSCGYEEKKFLLDSQILEICRSLIVAVEERERKLAANRVYESFVPASKTAISHFHSLFEVFAALLCSCDPNVLPNSSKFPKTAPTFHHPPTSLFPLDKLFKIPAERWETLFADTPDFIYKIIRDDVNEQAISQLIIHTAWENQKNTTFWLQLVADGTSASKTWDQFKPFAHVFTVLSLTPDSDWEKRMEKNILTYVKIIDHFESKSHPPFLTKLSGHLTDICQRDENFREIAKKYQSKISKSLGFPWSATD